ncbi:unnamed protein product [Dovyalis caffra]|uniref:Jacalin-type lectin domain-containing protein n=1 Tax=Dovyalis caffra TaxID=77055 RepID=A0AAV1SRZ9_9ROSI|nr:unnamed protein product [Dovyalis caffra]
MRSRKEKKLFIAEKSTDFIGSNSQEQDFKRNLKRKVSNQVDEGAGGKAKQSRKELKDMDQRVDFISAIPTHIIHHILSLLRCKKDAARTSALSKRWRDIWASFSILDFDERKFHQNQEVNFCGLCRKERGLIEKAREDEILKKKLMFRDFVDNTLQSCIEQKSGLQKFVLHVTSFDFQLADCLDRWIGFATESTIQELDLYIPPKSGCYRIPRTVFATKSITDLRIFGGSLGTCNDIRLSILRKLCLGKLRVCEKIINNLLLSCPSIEDLRLIQCSGLKTLMVSSNKLNRVDLDRCNALKDVELQAPHLQRFWFREKKSEICKINLALSKSLKSLTIEDAKMTDDLFQNHLSNFPVLQHLILSKCNSLESITISSHRLETLVLRECARLKEADIDTPNLLSFEYKGHQMPFSSLNPSGLKEARFYFEPHPIHHRQRVGFFKGDHDCIWFAPMQKLLEKFDLSKDLKLVVRYKKNVVIHEDLRDILVPPIHDLKLEIVKPSTSLEDLTDNLLRTWRPETLFVVSSATSDFSVQLYKKMVDRGDPVCCKYNTSSNKCWRHFLKDANIENLSDTTDTSDWITWLSISAHLLHLLSSHMENGKEVSKEPSGGRKKSSILVGPWGGHGGDSWDDGIYHGVREIKLFYDLCIDSIQVVYDKNGKPVTAEKHGGLGPLGGSRTAEIKLQYPEEYLTSMNGHYCRVVYGGSPVIRSLTFISNKRTFGPFGVEDGTPFTLTMDGASIVGFKGRSGWYLDAIGFRLSRIQSTKILQKFQQKLQRLTSAVSKSSVSKDGEKTY